MSGNNKVLLDTNVLIYASKALLDLEKLSKRYDVFFVSIITYMEIYAYDFVNAAELDAINKIFEALEIINIDLELSNQAILYLACLVFQKHLKICHELHELARISTKFIA